MNVAVHKVASVPLHRDPRIRGIVFQVSFIVFLIWFLNAMAVNTVANMEARGILLGTDWLYERVSVRVGFSPFIPYDQSGETSYLKLFFISVQNTLFVSFLGVIGATLLGFFIGVMRLSPNWLVSKLAMIYVEIFRNIPLLLWFFFWYYAVFLQLLPKLKNSINVGDFFFINNSGMYFPAPIVDNSTGAIVWMAIIAASFVAAFYTIRWAEKRQDKTGEQFPAGLAALAIIVIVPVIGFFVSGSPFHLEYPEIGRFQLEGGINLSTELFVCWFALTTYTAAFIAENVRGGILAVSHGQTEAAGALGLRHGKTLRLVVIPQAMRVIIPPTISQYLNLTKNSTLATAIAYEEIAALWMGSALNITGQALIIIAMTILVFSTTSLFTSFVLNWYNKRVQLAER